MGASHISDSPPSANVSPGDSISDKSRLDATASSMSRRSSALLVAMMCPGGAGGIGAKEVGVGVEAARAAAAVAVADAAAAGSVAAAAPVAAAAKMAAAEGVAAPAATAATAAVQGSMMP
jgi:hypothetical protein